MLRRLPSLAAVVLALGAAGPAAAPPSARAAPPRELLVLRAALDHGSVYACATDGDGGPRSIVRIGDDRTVRTLVPSARVEQLAVDGERVYWVGQDGVQAVGEQGGAVDSLAPRDWTMVASGAASAAGSGGRWGIVLDGDDVVFSLDGGVGRVSKQGGAAELAARGPGARVVAVDSADVWWLERPAPGVDDLLATPRTGGGAPRRVLAGIKGLLGVAIDDAGITWLAETRRPGVGAIHRASKTGGEATVLVDEVPTYYERVLAVAGGDVFWLDYPSGLHGPMRVRTVPRSGGAPVTLAEAFPPANELLVDDARIVWAEEGIHSIVRPGTPTGTRWPM